MNLERIQNIMMKIAVIGSDEVDGVMGTNRVFGSPAYLDGQEVTEDYFQECGLETYTDSVGNVHGILRCGKPDAGEILIGSHIDTVKEGGIFDGLLGVVAGAETAKEIKESGIALKKDIHIIGTNGEEGNDMGGTFGSRAMMGMLPLDDPEYIKLGKGFGFTRKMLQEGVLDASRADCWLEFHIEQGPTLDKRGEQIGIVTGIVGLRRYKVVVQGTNNHAGTTMMEDRDDALVAASRLVLMGDELARELGNNFVATVGLLQVFPSSVAVIPGRVEMVLEIRNISNELMDHFMELYAQRAEGLARCTISPMVKKDPIECGRQLVDKTEEICKKSGVKYRLMPSGATHDGNAMATQMPVGMIFVPSINGISHSRYEKTDWQDVLTGAEILKELVVELAAE